VVKGTWGGGGTRECKVSLHVETSVHGTTALELTAPDECSPQMKQLRMKQIPNTTAGYNVAVYREEEEEKKVKNEKTASASLICRTRTKRRLTHAERSFPPPMALQCSVQSAGEVAAEYAAGEKRPEELRRAEESGGDFLRDERVNESLTP